MRKFYIFSTFIFLFSLNPVISQSQPLAVENAVWIIGNIRTIGSVVNINYYAYNIEGDTTVNTIAYKKVYKYNFQEVTINPPNPLYILPPYPMHITPGSKQLFGLVRDYQQKVYAIIYGNLPPYPGTECPKNIEFELFDYTWQEGDTVRLCIHQNIPGVNKVTSIVPNSPPFNRKTFTVNFFSKYYEGIGTDRGLFEKFIELASSRLIDRTKLYDYCIGSLVGCGYAVNINKTEKPENKIKIFPNPAQDKIYINVKGFENLSHLQILIYDMQGLLLLNKTLEQNNTEIDISQLQQGVYVAKIEMMDGSFVQKKFLVIK